MSSIRFLSFKPALQWLAMGVLLAAVFSHGQVSAESRPPTVAFLGVEFLNDNAMYEPTSDAERARLKALETNFVEILSEAGLYTFLPVPQEMREKIAQGQPVGDCGGCEIDYGKSLNADRIAWIRVQKVSNLILNFNVYVADVEKERMTFERSVDVRGNTDETWAHSIKWLIKNYMLPEASS